MSTLNKNEKIAVGVSLVFVFIFMYFFTTLFMAKSNNDVKTAGISNNLPKNEVATRGSVVTVNYIGRFENGDIFDSSSGRGPITFTLGVGQVIKGWDEGLVGMKVGEKKHLVIPPSKAYGAEGVPSVIPPNSTLIFDVELVDVKNN